MKALWRSIKNWWLDYRTYRILTQLNDYQLKDIGLHRSSWDDQQTRPNLIGYVIRFHKAQKPWK